jgi:serine/threonine-protein kinase RsbW
MAEIEINIPATRLGLATAQLTIEEFAAARNLRADLVGRLRVVIEELVTNTIKYGYGGESERPIRLHLHFAGILTLIYQDEAPRFDPTAPRRHDPLARRRAGREGRAGLDLVLGLCSSATYDGQNGNRLVLTFIAPDQSAAAPAAT